MANNPRPQHRHAEAFCLMKYQSDDGTEEEIIWNSRDGVTPFVISLRSGKQARHVEWGRDRYEPDYKPKPGERIFVDMSKERRREIHLQNAKRYWPNAVGVVEFQDRVFAEATRQEFESPEALADYLTEDRTIQPGEPDLIEVKQ